MSAVIELPRRDELTETELLKRCRDAARSAMRSDQWSPDDREDCACALIVKTFEALAMPGERSQTILPRRDDPAYCFTAMRHRAIDWRDRTDAARDREALMGGPQDACEYIPPTEDELAPLDRWTKKAIDGAGEEYAAAADRQAFWEFSRSAKLACDELGFPVGKYAEGDDPDTLPTDPSPVACLVYQWIRDDSPETAAADLGASWQAWRKRTSRGAQTVREMYPTSDALIGAIAGTAIRCGDGAIAVAAQTGTEPNPRRLTFSHSKKSARGPAHAVPPIEIGQLMFSTTDASREVTTADRVKRTPDDRTGTLTGRDASGLDLTGQWPTRPETAADARARCAISEGPKLTEREVKRNRDRAAREMTRLANMRAGIESARHPARMTAAEIESQAIARLGGALQAGRPNKRDVGRTSGRPTDKYASREVRLGKNAG